MPGAPPLYPRGRGPPPSAERSPTRAGARPDRDVGGVLAYSSKLATALRPQNVAAKIIHYERLTTPRVPCKTDSSSRLAGVKQPETSSSPADKSHSPWWMTRRTVSGSPSSDPLALDQNLVHQGLSGKEAAAPASPAGFRLILLDVSMHADPWSGCETRQPVIRKRPLSPSTHPIICITSLGKPIIRFPKAIPRRGVLYLTPSSDVLRHEIFVFNLICTTKPLESSNKPSTSSGNSGPARCRAQFSTPNDRSLKS